MNELEIIIDKYEVPREYFNALFDAYAAGAKRGFVSGAIDTFNQAADLSGELQTLKGES